MKKGNTVYEDEALKEEARRKKTAERLKKHTVSCPHCGEDVLDHMTKCPHCGGELTPLGYKPMNEKLQKKIKIVTYSVGAAVAVAIILLLIFL